MNSHAGLARRLARLTALTAGGAVAAILFGLPIPLLVGPALATTLAALAGTDLRFPTPLRNAVFLVAGVTIGTTVTPASITALAKWPLAFLILGLAIVLMVALGRRLMQHMMRADTQSALLAATPGHLSYIIAIGEDRKLPIEQVAIVQSIRLLALTLLMPLAAYIGGVETGVGVGGSTAMEMGLAQTLLCLLAGALLIPVTQAMRMPAPTLMAGMAVGATARLSDLVAGPIHHWIAFPALAAIGALIGTRFVGLTVQDLRRFAGAGLAGTSLAALITLAAALLAAPIVEMPLLHVLIAFAPGGLETMTVMGATLGANPGFVAAAHVCRLLLLSALIPLFLHRI